MHILSSLLFSISANIDNFAVGIAYGIKKIKINILSNFLIAIISALGTFLSMSLGKAIIHFISAKTANILGSAILILLGLWFILEFFIKSYFQKKKKKNKLDNMIGEYKNILDNPELVDSDNSSCIDVKESILLAFALTINNLGVGIGASITGLNIFLTTIFTFIFSLLFIILGYLIGTSYLSKLFGKYASLISGAIIIFLGCYELFI